jgi:hypothetical protein
MIIISYDGQLQQSFEHVVRSIGTGRNMLRKGKVAAKMDAMAALEGSDDDSDDDAVMSKMGYRHRTGLSAMRSRAAMSQPPVSNSSTTPVEVFDSVDKALENAQSLCEKAAHQSLREGDCRKELDTVRGHFEEVQEAAKKEVARIAARKEKEAKDAVQAVQQDVKVEVAQVPVLEQKPLIPADTTPTAHSTHIISTVMDIEIDDEDDDDDADFVMPPIRLTSRV